MQFSLKDKLFNEEKVKRLASEIKGAYPAFDDHRFVTTLVAGFPPQELMERLHAIKSALREYLPFEYTQALTVILDALPPPLDPEKTDNDFGDFIYGPYTYFVAEYGCNKKHLKHSLAALKEITKRFTAEGALRDFLIKFPIETLEAASKWTKDNNYHVRRLASEGTRPNLPWAKKVSLKPGDTMPLLDALYTDHTRYVTRSVANHLNDIAKLNPDLVVKTLKHWQKNAGANDVDFITKHALRTLVKDGHTEALKLLGYQSPRITKPKIIITTPTVNVGGELEFTVKFASKSNSVQDLMIDYAIYFKKANGSLSPKTFKLAKKKLKAGESITVEKRQLLRPMSTRTLYAGTHELQLQINGEQSERYQFELL